MKKILLFIYRLPFKLIVFMFFCLLFVNLLSIYLLSLLQFDSSNINLNIFKELKKKFVTKK
jgi:hypothetical protein